MKKIALFIVYSILGVIFPVQLCASDAYWTSPQHTFEERRALFLDYYSEYGVEKGLYGIFRQVARAGAGKPLEYPLVDEAVNMMISNHDCTDFTLHGFLRLMYMDRKQNILTADAREKIKARILDFKYWWDEARKDTTYRCYHTENHQGMYHSVELLAGQLYKKEVFANGMTGKQHIKHAEKLLEQWMEYRFRFGFSEWLSTYYDEDVLFLANLYDYAEDKKIRNRAKALLDILMFDLALNSYQGMLGSTSGRTYATSLISGSHNTSPICKLMFGMGTFDREEVLGTTVLALSNYRCPEVIVEIAADQKSVMLNKQRVSMNVEDAPSYGLTYDNVLDGHYYWSMQEFIHPYAIKLSKQISEKNHVWPYGNYDSYIRRYEKEIEKYGSIRNMHVDRFALSEANITTYRTPDFMLSSVTDYRKGAPGYQQHTWQATLSNKALVYTNHPGGKNLRYSPNYWSGNEILPRVAQVNNVVVCIYNIPEKQKNGFSHAYFPMEEFDEVHISGNWIFGRKGNGYVALFSQHCTRLLPDMRGVLCDLKADARQNIWVCETGSADRWGSFEAFIQALKATSVAIDGLTVSYVSPEQGKISFGWEDPLCIDGVKQELRWKYRYDNPYCKVGLDSTEIVIRKGDKQWCINYR